MSVQDTLTKQILGQGLTSRWTGEGLGSKEANAADMARMLAEAGITDIKQFGKIPLYQNLEVQYWYDGKPASLNPDGKTVEAMVLGPYGYSYEKMPIEKTAKVYGIPEDLSNGFSPVDTSKVKFVDGKPVLETSNIGYGNKVTNQPVVSTYNKQGGNVFGGTREGAGTTGYQVDFTPDGTPVFYTSYSSNNNAKDFLPLLGIAGLAFGAPMLGEAFGAAGAGAAGAGLGAAELAALDLALGGAGGSLGAAELGAALAGGGAGAGAGMLESVFDPTFGGELSPVIGGGAESVFDPTSGGSALDAGMNAYPSTGSGLDAGMDAYPNTGNIGSPSSIKPSDIKRALDAASKVTGGNQPTTPGGTAGATGTATGTDPLSVLQQQASNASLLNLLGSKPELANIKSFKELFGEGLFGDSYVPPSAGGAQAAPVQYADSGTASQNEDEQQLFTGGHVDDFDVDALLQILRS